MDGPRLSSRERRTQWRSDGRRGTIPESTFAPETSRTRRASPSRTRWYAHHRACARAPCHLAFLAKSRCRLHRNNGKCVAAGIRCLGGQPGGNARSWRNRGRCRRCRQRAGALRATGGLARRRCHPGGWACGRCATWSRKPRPEALRWRAGHHPGNRRRARGDTGKHGRDGIFDEDGWKNQHQHGRRRRTPGALGRGARLPSASSPIARQTVVSRRTCKTSRVARRASRTSRTRSAYELTFTRDTRPPIATSPPFRSLERMDGNLPGRRADMAHICG